VRAEDDLAIVAADRGARDGCTLPVD
jgi:hypothetical protein